MNLVDNGCAKVISVDRVISEEILGFKITYLDYYNRECIRYVTSKVEVDKYVSGKIRWVE